MGDGTGLGRVRGLGSAKHGAHHWLVQRFTAVGNLLLMIWLGASLLLMPGYDYGTMVSWLSQPLTAVLMILLILCTFWHVRLGMQVLIEDYVHEEGLKFGVLTLLSFALIVGGAMGIFAIIRLALAATVSGASV